LIRIYRMKIKFGGDQSMKKFVSIIAMAIATVATVGCEQFSTKYDRIDDSEFRMLKYVWEPADAAPGDTITLTAVFAGKRVDLDSYLDWQVSFNVIRDLFGSTTVVDSVPLKAESRLVDFFAEHAGRRVQNPGAVGYREEERVHP